MFRKSRFTPLLTGLLVIGLIADPSWSFSRGETHSADLFVMVDGHEGRFKQEAFALRALEMLGSFSSKWSAWTRRWNLAPVRPAGLPGHIFLAENSDHEHREGSGAEGLVAKLTDALVVLARRWYLGVPLDLTEAYGILSHLDHEAAQLFSPIPLRQPSPSQWKQFYFAAMVALIHRGRLLSVRATPETLTVERGIIDPRTWVPIPYLGSVVYAADVEWAEFHGTSRLSYDEYAFVDPKSAKANASKAFQALAKPHTSRRPIEQAARQWLSKAKVNMDRYVELCGYVRLRESAIRSAQDHLFCALRLKLRPFQVGLEDVAYLMVKPSSNLLTYVQEGDLQSPEEQVKVGSVLMMLAGKMGGIISEMEQLLKKGSTDREKDLAYAIFLDFLAEQEKLYDTGAPPAQEDIGEYLVSFFLFEDIADRMRGNFSLGKIPALFEQGPGHPAEKALRFLKEVYDDDFYNDEERRAILSLPPETSAGHPGRGLGGSA